MASWAHLNDEGKKEVVNVFPEGTVPIRSIIPAVAVLPNVKPGDGPTEQAVYFVDVPALKPETLDKLIQKIASKFNAPPEEVRKSIVETEGVVLRTSLTSGAGTDNPAMFLPDFEDDTDLNDEDENIGEDDDSDPEDDYS